VTPEISLNILRPGEKAVIQRIGSAGHQTRQRLLELGLTRGTRIELVRMAPMGDPIEVRVKGYRLSLRGMEAKAVFVRREGIDTYHVS
jgi:ferrous iron transport protein A